MASGGYRPAAGRPKVTRAKVSAEIVRQTKGPRKTPLEHMLDVMNDPEADEVRRDRMAIAAAPYVHAKAEAEQDGKKARRQAVAVESVSAGKFAVPSGPTLVHSR